MTQSVFRQLLTSIRHRWSAAFGFVPPGHFYSPFVSMDEIRRDEKRLFSLPAEPPAGIEMNEAGQLELLDQFATLYPSIDFPHVRSDSHRYFYENPAYSYSDAIMLHCMMRHVRPRRLIEVGSGYSSCAILDTSERHLAGNVDVTFIEPYPQLLQSLLRPSDLRKSELIPARLQDVPLEKFRSLQAGDILFIDSSHVSKTGSDVNYLFFDILPSLRSGVHIHIHDTFYPFEYPRDWVMEGRCWNELYVLRAFLQYNGAYSISLMNNYLVQVHEQKLADRMPLCLRNGGGSLWLRKH